MPQGHGAGLVVQLQKATDDIVSSKMRQNAPIGINPPTSDCLMYLQPLYHPTAMPFGVSTSYKRNVVLANLSYDLHAALKLSDQTHQFLLFQ